MDLPPSQEDSVGAWSEDKLSLLRKYLEAYSKIMRRQSWLRGFHYIDAFAGTGRPRARDEERFIDGSPRIALTIQYPFDSYRFIEIEPWRVERLEELSQEFPKRNIRIYQGDCNEVISREIASEIRYENYNRGFVFLDPFTMNIEWSTIQTIAETKAMEIFINFPVMALNRTVLPNVAYQLTEKQVERMNAFWGSTEWRGLIYDEVRDLWGNVVEIKIERTTGMLLGKLFRSRLEQVFKFVTTPLVMRNSVGAPLYCLIFAGHNEIGASITQSIFEQYERLGR